MTKPTPEHDWKSFVSSLGVGHRPPFSEHRRIFRELQVDWPESEGPPPVWWPDDDAQHNSNAAKLMDAIGVDRFSALHRFSVEHKEEFWQRVLARLGIVFAEPPERILDESRGPTDPRWLPGARLNVTQSCFNASSDTVAVTFGREGTEDIESITVGALERDTFRFAAGLTRAGFQPDDAVALYMPMTPACVIAYLGIVRAGCRVVSIADSFGAEQVFRRMHLARARGVVTVSSYVRAGRTIRLYDKLREAVQLLENAEEAPTAIVIEPAELEPGDLSWDDFLDGVEPTPPFISGPDQVTNVLFSSGTTGDPKAIPWTQLAPLKAAMDAHLHQDVRKGDVLCWPTNVGWMMGPWLIYASLVNGATMALYEGAPAGDGFKTFVRDSRVTILGLVPSIVRGFRAAETLTPGCWPDARLFSSTGEASNVDDYLWLMSVCDYRAPVIEYLGGTEIGGGHLAGTTLRPVSPSTFSTPALGIDVVVLDEAHRPVPEETMGELFLVPPALGLSQSLLNRDHDEVYYAGCPTGPNGEVLRRHGDQITRLSQGYFKASGRADDTMNLGGIKVSSIEIETVVNGHPSVFESAAIGVQPSGEGAEVLVLFVVVDPSGGSDPIEDLQGALARLVATRLNPLFKVADVVPIEELPRTASNKIMRRKLRARYGTASS